MSYSYPRQSNQNEIVDLLAEQILERIVLRFEDENHSDPVFRKFREFVRKRIEENSQASLVATDEDQLCLISLKETARRFNRHPKAFARVAKSKYGLRVIKDGNRNCYLEREVNEVLRKMRKESLRFN